MNLKNLFAKLSLVVVLLTFFAANAFAQTYVSNTNGNDVTGNGQDVGVGIPYKTIAKAIQMTADGGTIIIDADTYNEAGPIDLTGGGSGKNLTFVARTFNSLSTVTITNGIALTTAKTISLGETGVKFQTGIVNLTDGTLNISSANLVINGGGTITRTAGTLNVNPTTTNVNVTYNGTADVTAGGELPSSLGTGTLTVSITAGKTLTIPNAVSFSNAGKINVTSGHVTFNGNVSFNYSAGTIIVDAITNAGANTVTFNGAVILSRSGGTNTITLKNTSTGTLAFVGGVTNNNSADITLHLTNSSTGTVKLGSSSFNGTIANNTGGVIELLNSVTFSGGTVGNAGSTIKLGGNQLTLSNAAVALNNTGGNIISTTASTVGNGMLNITGGVTLTGGGELPNVTVATGGSLILPNAVVPVYGSFTLNSTAAGALTFNVAGGTLEIWGDSFNRTDNTPGNVVIGTGTLSFRGGLAQSFVPGASLQLYNMVVNKTASTVVTLSASVEVTNNLTITSGTLNVGNYNLNLTGNPSTFDNSGQAYSSSGIGYVAYLGASGVIQGSGQFNNILVNLSVPANSVNTGSSIKVSGILYINQGTFNVAVGHTLTMNNALVANPTVKINTTTANAALFTNAGTVTYSANVNLYYFGANNYTAGAEWSGTPTKINDVTIATDGGTTVTGVNAASTIYGTLTVNGNTTLAQGANTYSLAGDGKTHSIVGTVTGGTLEVTGSGSAVNGTTSTTAGFNGEVNHLSFEPAANNATFTSSNLKKINGNLTLQGTSTKTGATATVVMNPTTATLTGNLNVGNGTLGPVASVTINGSTTSVLTGNVLLTDGTLTLTRGGASTTIGGGVTLTKGTLVLGSNVSVTSQTAQAAGNIDAGGFKYTQLGSVASPDYNRTGAGTFTNGTLVLNSTAGAIDLTPGATFTVPNLESVGTANGVTINAGMEITNSLLFDNASTFTQTGVLTVSGNTITVTNDAGAFTGAITFKGTAATLTLGQNYTFPTMVLNTTGSLTVAGNPATTARTLFVTTAYTNTAGTINLGIHTLDVSTAFTWTAGTITQTTGYLNLNVASPTIPASGWSVDNLKVYTTAANFGTSAFTVVKNLVMAQSITTSADGKMTLGDGCLIERQGNGFTLAKLPTFGANTDVKYSTYTGGVDITTAKELPASVRNLTIATSDATANNADAIEVVLTANLTVTGTLSLNDKLDATTNTKTITMADGSVLELKINGTVALDQDLVKAGAMHLIYNGAGATSTRELGALVSGAYPAFAGNVTIKSLVAQNAPTTWNGTFTFDGNNYDLSGNNITLGGTVVTTANGGTFVNTGAAAFLDIAGSGNSTFGLGGNWAVPAAIKFRLNKANNTDVVTLTGGNLDFATNSQVLYFKNGVLKTGNNVVILQHTAVAGVPQQGFDRSGVTGTNQSHVVGNVRKYLDVVTSADGNTPAIRLTRVEFPVGTEPSSPAYYRPMAFQFNTLPTANFNLTVNHVVGDPAGTNGFPITDGSLTLANYPAFYWLVTSDLTLQPQVKYDIEAEAYGYGSVNYPEGIQNIRFLRRFDTDVNNPWLLQGGLGYDNSTNVDHAKVIVRNAEGAISTQGARFTYSQIAKAPTVTTASAAVTVAEGSALTVTWTAASKNLGGTATFEATPVWTATAPAVVPTNATFNASTGTLTWTPDYTQAGVYTITVKAVDGTLSTTNTVTITVTNTNRAPSFTGTGTATMTDQTIPYGTAKSFTYVATDADGETLTYSVAVDVAPAGTYSISNAFGSVGLFTFTPTFADLGNVYTFTITATDPNAATATSVVKLTVAKAFERGDATLNGVVDINDAIKILDYTVGKTTLTAEAMIYADCNTATGDGQVGAFDAAYVLKYIANNNSWSGVTKSVAVAGAVEFSKLSSEAGVVTLPLIVNNAKGVTSIYAEAELGQLEIGKVTSRLPEGWLVSTTTENGKVKFAAAGVNPLSDGIFATIEVKLKDKETAVSVVGNAKLNDELSSSLQAKVREIPSEYTLSQNYPNPFNPTTTIKFSVAQDAKVSLVVYDMLGQKVRTLVDAQQEAGYYSVRWDGTNDFGSKVSSGIYIYRLQAGNFVQTMKMNLMK
ncbi:FlgD immunoglobulin-like domain containing protein [Stygiobacter electus]|uniref:T9SS type A sorting domain-containing protein n=1 Tax=Stygiobacter electus TaxID=3032292 RepID=A0AAE3P0E2_9BACT|nr:T9SS type A sorting domain-containing protein [Stygiobacter electus]MDF1611784.1 T9SS type A sorting domain-containing protein [Stygiobacter electus]